MSLFPMSIATLGLFLFTGLSASLMITSQKLLTDHSPYWIYVVVFAVSLVVSLAAYAIRDTPSIKSMTRSPWMIALGIALVTLNLGYVWLYQQDINLAYVPLIVTGIMTICAIGVGYFFLEESFSRQAVMGICIVLVGLRLIATG